MLKLKKVNSVCWEGNGFGTSPAEWVVAGHENIAVRKVGGMWFALDLTNTKKLEHLDVPIRIARAETRADLMSALTTKLAA